MVIAHRAGNFHREAWAKARLRCFWLIKAASERAAVEENYRTGAILSYNTFSYSSEDLNNGSFTDP
jgi:hypothetical protein